MPYGVLEYGVRYFIERGHYAIALHDALRLGSRIEALDMLSFEIRGRGRDYIGVAMVSIEGIHRVPKSKPMLYLFGQFRSGPDKAKGDIWAKAFFFAEYDLPKLRGNILLGQESFLKNPLSVLGPYEDVEDEI